LGGTPDGNLFNHIPGGEWVYNACRFRSQKGNPD
jgi:hypothetical protein